MVKPDRLPIRNGVAVGAGRAQPSQMRFVLLVAGNAGCRSFCKSHPRLVATGTVRLLVSADQRIVRKIVIECGGLQPHDVGAAPNMLGVTGLAFRAFHLGPFSVKPRSCPYVGTDLGVTVDAKVGLGLLVERLVTKRTFFLLLNVSSRQFAR